MEGLDIRAQTVALAEMVGIKRKTITEMVLRPGEMTVTYFVPNEHGSPYVVNDKDSPQHNTVATETKTFRVDAS